LLNLGYEIGRNTIKRILLETGIDPARERRHHVGWMVRFYVLWVIDLATRRIIVETAGTDDKTKAFHSPR
jgi:hypothetical protein